MPFFLWAIDFDLGVEMVLFFFRCSRLDFGLIFGRFLGALLWTKKWIESLRHDGCFSSFFWRGGANVMEQLWINAEWLALFIVVFLLPNSWFHFYSIFICQWTLTEGRIVRWSRVWNFRFGYNLVKVMVALCLKHMFYHCCWWCLHKVWTNIVLKIAFVAENITDYQF